MSRSVNKVILVGNVGGDPEVRAVSTGARVATFSLATGRTWTDAQGVKQEKTEWHRCVVWNSARGGGLADVVEKYVRKGAKLYVEGSIEYRQWQDKDGQTRYTTEIKVTELVMLGDGSSQGGSARPSTNAGSSKPRASKPADDDFSDFPGALEDEDDDLPF